MTLADEVGHLKEVDVSNGIESINEREDLLAEKFENLSEEVRKSLESFVKESGVVAWSLNDLLQADFSVRHNLEMKDETPLSNLVRSLPPKLNEIVSKELPRCWTLGSSNLVCQVGPLPS